MKKYATLITIIVATVFTTTACTVMSEYAVDSIKSYCATTTEAERTVIRERFNSKVAPHQVLIYCEK